MYHTTNENNELSPTGDISIILLLFHRKVEYGCLSKKTDLHDRVPWQDLLKTRKTWKEKKLFYRFSNLKKPIHFSRTLSIQPNRAPLACTHDQKQGSLYLLLLICQAHLASMPWAFDRNTWTRNCLCFPLLSMSEKKEQKIRMNACFSLTSQYTQSQSMY